MVLSRIKEIFLLAKYLGRERRARHMCRYMKHVPGCSHTFRACICVEEAFTAPKDGGSSRGQFSDVEMKEESTCEREIGGEKETNRME